MWRGTAQPLTFWVWELTMVNFRGFSTWRVFTSMAYLYGIAHMEIFTNTGRMQHGGLELSGAMFHSNRLKQMTQMIQINILSRTMIRHVMKIMKDLGCPMFRQQQSQWSQWLGWRRAFYVFLSGCDELMPRHMAYIWYMAYGPIRFGMNNHFLTSYGVKTPSPKKE